MLSGREAEEDTGPAEYRDQHDDFASDHIGDIPPVEADHHAGQRANRDCKACLGWGSTEHLG
ncbi:hypothetical protein D3C80_1306700 [compost metagenome]